MGVDVESGSGHCERAGVAGPPGVDPRGIGNGNGSGCPVIAVQVRVPACGGEHRGLLTQIALIVGAVHAGADPPSVSVADGEIGGEPAVHGLLDAAAGHAQLACRAGVALLAGEVTVAADQPGQAGTQHLQWLVAGCGQPVVTRVAVRAAIGEVAPQLVGAQVVGVRQPIQVGLDGFAANRCDGPW